MNRRYLIAYFFFVTSIFTITYSLVRIDENIKYSYEVANKKLAEARITLDSEDVKEAEKLIDDVISEKDKTSLRKSLAEIKRDIEKEMIKDNYDERIKKLSSSLNEKELASIKLDISKIKYDDVKEYLNKKIVPIETKINKKKEEAKKKQSAYNKLVQADKTVPKSTPPKNVRVLERLKGNITAFTPYCKGCHGYVASGKFVGNGNIHYHDKTYGDVYIVAGDPSYPLGTIVRLKNVDYFGGRDIYAIVLDRGGAIGKNRRALFDLLFALESNANKFGVRRNVTCEILRKGY